jgi:hypothetical protein
MGFPYASLQAASVDTYNALLPTYQNAADPVLGVVPTATAFCVAVKPIFPATNLSSQPCMNSFAIVYALVAQLPSVASMVSPTQMPITTFATLVAAISRLLSLASYLNASSPSLVTNAQAAALLSAFNTAFSGG